MNHGHRTTWNLNPQSRAVSSLFDVLVSCSRSGNNSKDYRSSGPYHEALSARCVRIDMNDDKTERPPGKPQQ